MFSKNFPLGTFIKHHRILKQHFYRICKLLLQLFLFRATTFDLNNILKNLICKRLRALTSKNTDDLIQRHLI